MQTRNCGLRFAVCGLPDAKGLYSSTDSLLGRGLKGREGVRRFQECKKRKRYVRKGRKELIPPTSSCGRLAPKFPSTPLPHPFWSWLEGGYFACLTFLWIFCFKTGAVSFGTCSILQYEKVRSSYIHKNQAYFPSTGSKKQFGIRDMVCVELLHECFTVYHLLIFIS